METVDVLVVGAGLAGLHTARRLAHRGLTVTVVDRRRSLSTGIRTTGIFVRRTLDDFDLPGHLLGPALGERRPSAVGGVRIDFESGIRQALRHLVERGHERIAMLDDRDRQGAAYPALRTGRQSPIGAVLTRSLGIAQTSGAAAVGLVHLVAALAVIRSAAAVPDQVDVAPWAGRSAPAGLAFREGQGDVSASVGDRRAARRAG
jgi:glycine/D-amino acid oxidase-like deaminating enzyme